MTGNQMLVFEVEAYLEENFEFRRNVVSGKTEYRIKNHRDRYIDPKIVSQCTCPCATRRTSIYKGLATFHIRCSRNCQ